MKRFTFTLAILTMIASTIGNTLSAQEKNSGERKYHLKIEKIENGKKVKLDTVVTSDEPFTWNGQTIHPGQSTMTMSSDDASMKKFSYTIDKDGKADIIVLKKGKEGSDSLEVVVEADVDITRDAMKNHTIHVWSDEEGHSWKFAPEMVVPDRNHMIIFDEELHGKNVIDLSDPGIISYKKKLLKDGTEKITIVRKRKQNSKKSGEIIIKKQSASLHQPRPEEIHEIEVIKGEDGKTKVIDHDSNESFEVDGGEGMKIIKKDGKVYRIKETDDGKNKEMEVEVENDRNE